MIFAYLCMIFGVGAWFVPEPVQVPMLVAALVCAALYVRAMNRRAREDVR